MRWALVLLLFAPLFCSAQDAWTDKTRVLPDKLREVPESILIRHSPNPNYPEENDETSESKALYVWKHSTSVSALDMDLEVVEAGSFIWFSENGWYPNVQLSKKEFSKKFDCPKGQLRKGEIYVFERNYRYGDQLYGGDALWYVIAKDSDGKLYKGFSILETESQLKTK